MCPNKCVRATTKPSIWKVILYSRVRARYAVQVGADYFLFLYKIHELKLNEDFYICALINVYAQRPSRPFGKLYYILEFVLVMRFKLVLTIFCSYIKYTN